MLLGANAEGTQELLAVHDGIRESKISWQEFLNDLKRRGLTINPSLAIGNGTLGFWAALEEAFPCCEQKIG